MRGEAELQATRILLSLELGILEFAWDLDLGIWGFSQPDLRLGTAASTFSTPIFES